IVTQRAQRNPIKPWKSNGSWVAFTVKTPAAWAKMKLPPRSSAPGRALTPAPPDPPKQLWSAPGMPAEVVQSVQVDPNPAFRSTQSATPSSTSPTMSNTPQLDLQFEREPVLTGPPPVAQSVVPLSVPGSGVPAAARCHSSLRTNRFPETAHACTA